MSLMQVLTRDSLQSTTPYSFLGSSSNFIEDASTRENCTTDQDYISRDTRNISVSDASTTSHVDQHQQQAHVAQQLRREKMRINNQMSDMHSDLYNFSSGAELLAAAAGGGGLVYSGQGGGYGNQGGTMMSNKNWTGMNSYSSNSLGSHNGTAPATQNALPATLLVGSGLQYNPGSYNFGGSNANAQAEAMQQLYLMNAAAGGYATYPSSSDTGNMVFVSPSNNSQMGQLVGIPLHTSLPQNSLSQNSQVTSVSNSPVAYQGRGNSGGQQAFNSWRTGGDELLFMPASDATTSQRSPAAAAAAAAAGESYSNQEGNSIGLSNFSSDYEASIQQQPLMGNSGYQSLSLSLSSQQPQPLHYDVIQTSGLDSPAALSQDGKRSGSKLTGDLSHFRREASEYSKPQNPVDSATVGSSAMSASFNVISNSRYLKACQQLLDEVCSVGRGAKQIKTSKSWAGASPVGTSSPSTKGAGGTLPDQTSGPKDGNVSSVDGTAAVTTASTNEAAVSSAAIAVEVVTKVLTAEERQEYEAKKTKLLAMLQEVDRRYRQYYDQMQVVITSFDAVASIGAATPYTALALQAMSRYFRCLRDAITGQIQATCKALGEEDISRHLTNKSPTSRLRFVDQHLRQQRAFQQLGMLQQHAWRPQRGLPERSVSILRAWLFEHFLHPYPKDSDKMMLARQTGLTRNQVSNWFINARVRLWKPMVEEMYQEESRDQELDAAVSRLRAESDETGNYREANSDMNNSGDKPSKGGAAEQQCDSRPKADGNQDFVDSMAALASDNYPVNSSQIRKQHSDGQMFDEVQQQLKKSRFGNHNDMLQGLDVQMKSEMNDNGISESTHHHGLPNNGSLYGAYDSNRYASEFSSARYSATATGASTGVSLTLGLQHSDSLALAGARHAYLHGAGGTGSFEGVSRRDNVADHEYMNLYDSATAAAAAAGLGHIGGHESMNYATGRSHFVA